MNFLRRYWLWVVGYLLAARFWPSSPLLRPGAWVWGLLGASVGAGGREGLQPSGVMPYFYGRKKVMAPEDVVLDTPKNNPESGGSVIPPTFEP